MKIFKDVYHKDVYLNDVLPICHCPYSHFCIKAIRILRMNAREGTNFFIVGIFIIFPSFDLSFLQAMPADYSPHRFPKHFFHIIGQV
jgi:hypothetical protein